MNRQIDFDIKHQHKVAADQELAGEIERDLCLDLLMSHVVQPKLGSNGFEFLFDYPASQAALAKIKEDQTGHPVARRAELFFQGIELANAYDELCDPEEFMRRFERDCRVKEALGQPRPGLDELLADAMRAGIPSCAGVALGLDRLIAIAGRWPNPAN